MTVLAFWINTNISFLSWYMGFGSLPDRKMPRGSYYMDYILDIAMPTLIYSSLMMTRRREKQ
uniref:Uncharacterized protein n=1 Tax=Rhizophora mucronata TaxID=61149 RepID=A0A2P2L696_RHIMU